MNIVNGSFSICFKEKMSVAGHASDKSLREGYDGTVEVNFIALLSKDKDIYVIQIDTLYVDDSLRLEVQKRLKRGNISIVVLCVANHSHSLPGIDIDKPELGVYFSNYRNFLKEKIVTNITKSTHDKDLEQVSLSSYKKYSHLSIGRRGSKSKTNFSLLSLRNTVPDFSRLGAYIELTCLWDKNKKRILAVIWTFPAHPVLYPGKKRFSADFPGRVRDLLREELQDPSLPVLYFPGCTGDMRPKIKLQTKRKNPFDFIVGQSFEECDMNQYEEYCVSLKTELNECIELLKNEDSDEIIKSIHYQESKIPLEKIGITNRSNKYLRVELLQFNKDYKFVFLNCEPSYAYHNFFGDDFTVTGYSSGVFGYLPADIQINQGGYEVSGFMPFFGTSGSFIKEVEETIRDECTINQS